MVSFSFFISLHRFSQQMEHASQMICTCLKRSETRQIKYEFCRLQFFFFIPLAASDLSAYTYRGDMKITLIICSLLKKKRKKSMQLREYETSWGAIYSDGVCNPNIFHAWYIYHLGINNPVRKNFDCKLKENN